MTELIINTADYLSSTSFISPVTCGQGVLTSEDFKPSLFLSFVDNLCNKQTGWNSAASLTASLLKHVSINLTVSHFHDSTDSHICSESTQRQANKNTKKMLQFGSQAD